MDTRHRRTWTVAFVVWLCVVWGHSLMQGETSSAESMALVNLVRPLFELLGCHDVSLMSFIIRKTAHFTEYAVLMALAQGMAQAWLGRSRAALALTLAIWVVAPSIDEAIQLSTPGRAGMLRDVLIDMSGGLTGAIIASLVRRKRSKPTKASAAG